MTLQQVLKESFNMKESEYQDDKSLTELEDWDSMNHMIFITRLEEAFGIELSGAEVIALEKIGDVKMLLENKGKKETV